jgi:hypothetical protein
MDDLGRRPRWGRRRSLAVLAFACVVIAAVVIALLPVSRPSGGHSDTSQAPSTIPSGPGFHVSGTQIVGPDGQPFVPYGIVVFGLADPDWSGYVTPDLAQIHAIATAWHSNTVRLQVSPNFVVSGGQTHAYEAALKHEVSYAESLHLVVIISCQTEHTTRALMPDATVLKFWQVIAPMYSGDPDVWFDLFNEPRMKLASGAGSAPLWQIWQNGGDGYVGMQALVNAIRGSANNLILAEGLHFARTLKGLQQHMLKGTDIVYEVHAFFVKPHFTTPADWAADWGDLSRTVPVIIGAWSQYENGHGDCVSNAAALVQTFLSFVTAHHLGLIAWTLSPGVLIQGSNLDQPTQFVPSEPYVCTNEADKLHPQGAGAVLMAYFAAHSKPSTASR